jgi:anthranilate synthase component 1
MYSLTLAQVQALGRRGNWIPLSRQIPADFETPLSAFLKLEGTGPAYLLESVEGGEQLARYSFLGSGPRMIFRSRGNQRVLVREGRISRFKSTRDPLSELRELLAPFKTVAGDGLPRFGGGVVGYAGYDLVRFFEPVPEKTRDDLGAPDAFFLLSDTVVIFDHVEHSLKVVAYVDLTRNKAVSRAYQEAAAKIDRMVERLKGPLPKPPKARPSPRRPFTVRSNVTRSRFLTMVRRTKQAISRGEIIQGVISQRFEVKTKADPFSIYRRLRSLNPSPYMFYLNLGELTLIGSSPEILVRAESGVVRTRPIAGTRPRGKTEAEDRRLAAELKADPKERAEHLMLVDLGRNDLGRVCAYGSVKVNAFMAIERYSHVMHLVSDVTGKPKKSVDALDCLRAAFPAGTVTGAPKVRAMQIIEELEPTRRGPYAGAVGYLSFSGNLDTCITIRTILVKGDTAYVQAGAGIVADSKPDREYQETRNKAAGMLEAIRLAEEEPR